MMTMGFWLVLGLFLDQASKLWIEHHVQIGQQFPVIDGLFKITHVKNSGIAFGLFQGYGDTLRLIVLAIAVFVFILGIRYARKSKLLGFAFGSIVGGALGNLLDRFLRDGWVIDFLAFWDFAIFNVSDSFIVFGAIGLGFYTLFSEHRQAKPMIDGEKNPENVVTQLRRHLEKNVFWHTDLTQLGTLLTDWFILQKIPYQLHLYDVSIPEESRTTALAGKKPGTNAFVDILPGIASEPQEKLRFFERITDQVCQEEASGEVTSEGEILFVVKKDKRNRKTIKERPLKFSSMKFSELKPMTENPNFLPMSMMRNSSATPLALTKEEKIAGKLDEFRIIITRTENREKTSSAENSPEGTSELNEKSREETLSSVKLKSGVEGRAGSHSQDETDAGGIRGMGLTFLLEVLTEELPPSEIPELLVNLEEKFGKCFQEHGFRPTGMEGFIAARRFGIVVSGLDPQQPDREERKKGPACKVAFTDETRQEPTRALTGFLAGNGAEIREIEIEEVNGVPYVFLRRKIPGISTIDVLAATIPSLLSGLDFRRPMRWGEGETAFVRPVHGFLALLGSDIVPFTCFGVTSGRTTHGHRFLGSETVIGHAEDYFDTMKKQFVFVRQNEREELIRKQLADLSEAHAVEIPADEALLQEVTWLTEYPQAVMGQFRPDFKILPKEVLITTLKHHQRTFPVLKGGELTSGFVSFQDNGEASKANVVKGYEKVINARLSDARFFFEEDQKTTLSARLEGLKNVLFQKGLGSTFDKVDRNRSLTAYLCVTLNVPSGEKVLMDQAAHLSKSDLLTAMVYEFPELQGIMGRVYSCLEGIDPTVSKALEEQYWPTVPESVAGAILSLADKMDVLCGNLWLGNIPSGSKDPYGLRKKLYQIIETAVSFNWDIRLDDFFRHGIRQFTKGQTAQPTGAGTGKERSEDGLLSTFKEIAQSRLEFYLQGKGLPYDVIRAVKHHWATPMRAAIAAESLQGFRAEPTFLQVSTLFERVHNITRNETATDFDSRLFEVEAEKALFIRYTETKDTVLSHINHLNYRDALISLMGLKDAINHYFDDVFVMVDREDLRLTRLRFLKSIDYLFMAAADLSLIEKDGGAQTDSVVSENRNPEERGIPNGE